MSRLRRVLGAVVAAAALTLAPTAPSFAADGTIAHVEDTKAGLRILVSVPPDAEIDLDNPQVVIDGETSDAEAVLAGTDTRIKRTTVLAIDTSASMAGGRFKAAKAAARAFIESVPDDVFVGIVTFDAQVNEALVPTTDRDQARAVLGSLSLSKDTRLYDGVLTALEMAGTEGQRSVLVLSDGADTSKTTIGSVTEAIEASETSIDVVALEQDADQIGPLRQLADAGAGRVISSDSDELSAAFADEAAILASQVLVTAQVPDSVTSSQASIAVTLPSATGDIYATAYSTIESAKKKSAKDKTATEVALPRQDEAGKTTPDWLIYAGVGVLGLGLLMLMLMLVPAKRKPLTAAERIATYGAAGSGITPSADQDEEAVLTTAMHAAEELLEHNRGLDARISHRLEGAGSELKASEWLLLHAAVFIGSGALGVLIGKGSVPVGLVFLVFGAVGPWFYLSLRRTRRKKAFHSALPDTLQLISGSLAAGLSLAQSMDTVVREGNEPVAVGVQAGPDRDPARRPAGGRSRCSGRAVREQGLRVGGDGDQDPA